MVQINFNANEVAPASGFEPLPAGEYVALIEASETKATKKGDGHYLQFTFRVIEGQHENRKLWSRINVINPSAEAQRIGLAELSALCRAVGVMELADTNESYRLHDRPLRIVVAMEKRKDTGDLTNVVKAYKANGPAVGAASAPVAKPVAAAVKPPAWAQK